MNKSAEKGKNGEKFVAKYLENKGFKICRTNYHSRYGEIDIICENEKYIVFVEVKLRRKNSAIRGIECVGKSKKVKIIKTAFVYLINNFCSKQPRFDVAELNEDNVDGTLSLNYFENAFDAEVYNAFF